MQTWPPPTARYGNGRGALLSLLLHGLLLLLALWYLAHRPITDEPQIRALPVELVIGGTLGQGASTAPATRLQVARPHPESTPVPQGVRPNATKDLEDELSVKLRAMAQLKTPDAALPNADNSAAPGG